jgi:hypothetical protein
MPSTVLAPAFGSNPYFAGAKCPGCRAECRLGNLRKASAPRLIAAAEQHAKALKQNTNPSGGGFILLDRAEVFLRLIADGGNAS